MMRLTALALLVFAACNGPTPKDSGKDDSGTGDSCCTASSDSDGDGFSADADCDDGDAAINPDATEICDGADNDCDGNTDEDGADGAATFYADGDGDGYGDVSDALAACAQPAGYVGDATDCDDSSAAVFPGAAEICDGFDNDCDGDTDTDSDVVDAPTWYTDMDADGYGDPATGTAACAAPAGMVADGTDCDDADAAYHPGADESDCEDPNDYNCDGSTGYADADGDSFAACVDCDDTDAGSHPGADEFCDLADNDCDGGIDEEALDRLYGYADTDGDGFGDAAVSALYCELPAGTVSDATDCDDARAESNPAATEYCNGEDDDCDGATDEDASADAAIWYADADGDGYGDAADSAPACAQPAGRVGDATDCDDGAGGVNPGALEVCDAGATDEDCSGAADDADPGVSPASRATFHADSDGDGYGDPAVALDACLQPAGHVTDATDCDDGAAAVNPAAQEICDALNVDEDCSGAADDSDTGVDGATFSTWYADRDGDSYGEAASTARTCDRPAGYVADSADCDDAAAAINPAAQEVCDALNVDEDCDGLSDDADSSASAATFGTWYADADGDSYGDAGAIAQTCDLPAGYVTDSADCDDSDAGINPAALEICDGGDGADTDEDCSGAADDADPGVETSTLTTFALDSDGDGYGDALVTEESCNTPPGYVADATDCDDGAAGVNPGAQEVCDAGDVDEDCDGLSDDADAGVEPSGFSAWYADGDSDGYGAGTAAYFCDLQPGYAAAGTDCNDSRAAINPGAQEICDAADRDEDCDGLSDDNDTSATGQSTWYADGDSDGYGGTGAGGSFCNQPSGYASGSNDCDDGNSAVHPGVVEAPALCENHLDDNCSGSDDCRDEGVFLETLAADVTLTGVNGSTAATFFGGHIAKGNSTVGGYDVSGDGYPDLLIGDREYDVTSASGDANRGRAIVLRGGAGGLQDTVASPLVSMLGAANGDRGGAGLSFVSDLDGDGDDELLVGAYLANPLVSATAVTDGGAVYLLKGGAGLSGTLGGSDAFITVTGSVRSDSVGWSSSDGGDLTGDGSPDWAVGGYSPAVTAGTTTNRGTVAVISGTASTGRWTISSTANNAAVITGTADGDRIGASVLGNVDTDGDGLPELLVTSAQLATTWIFEAPLTGSLTRADADATLTGHDLVYSATYDINCTPCVADAGDVDGDGRTDLLFGSDGYDYQAVTNSGAAFLISGAATLPSGAIPALSDMQIYGVFASDVVGRAVGGGDFNGDTFSDLLIGASGFDNPLLGAGNNTGVAAVLYGPISGTISLAALPSSGYAVYGSITSSESLGAEAGYVGDLDADGFDDFFIGAPNYNPGTRAGRGFVHYGTGE